MKSPNIFGIPLPTTLIGWAQTAFLALIFYAVIFFLGYLSQL